MLHKMFLMEITLKRQSVIPQTSPRFTFPEFITGTIRSWQKSCKKESARSQNQFTSRQESKNISAAKEAQTEIFFLEVTMAFLHHESQECTKSELDLFTIPATQTSISKGQWIEYHPISNITDSGPSDRILCFGNRR